MASLVNVGATCSINSVLQVIAHLDFDITVLPKTKSGTLNRALVEIIHLMKLNKDKRITPNRFLTNLYEHLTMFSKGEQLDVQELFIMLSAQIFKETGIDDVSDKHLDDAEIQIRQHNEYKTSMWNDLFQGVLLTKIVCKSCNNTSERYEPFYTLSLSPGKSMIHMIMELFKKSVVDNDDTWKCDKCKNNSFIKSVRMYSVPKYIPVHISRYTNEVTKNNEDVDITKKISISKNAFINNKKDVILEHCSSICHQGVLSGGHYYTNINDEVIYDDDNKYPYNNYHNKFTYLAFYKVLRDD